MSFLQRLFKSKIKNVNLTICGLDKAGKTAIINYLIHGEFLETIPTHGLNREKINLPKLHIDVFDLGGQSEFRPIWSDYNEQSDGMIFVVDISDRERIGESKVIFHDIINSQINQNIPVLILLNKCDLPDKIHLMDFIREFALNDPNLEIKWAVFETSAKTGEGILDSMGWIINRFGGE
ncbi:MAG: GTP-binding protein [Candidatus Heimdallarchaeota archaeon]|nr:GTP-binding protein [Candidatus Heimdallarchaeota archaeon]